MNIVTKRLGNVEVGGKTPVSAMFLIWVPRAVERRTARFSHTRTTIRCVERWIMLIDVAQRPMKEVNPKFVTMGPKSTMDKVRAIHSAILACRVIIGGWSMIG